MNMITIYDAKEIREIRKILGMNPTQFAAQLGVSASMVSYWERDRSSPKSAIHEKMTALLKERGIEPEHLFKSPAA